MVLRAALLALAIGLLPPSAGSAVGVEAVPDEPGAVVLPNAPILQAVAADLDGDGARELIRLVLRVGEAPFAEVWRLDPGGWGLVGDPVEVLAQDPGGPRGVQAPEAEPAETVALRLIVHRVGVREHVVVASQPRFGETGYRLELHDLAIEAGEVRRVPVAQPADPVDGILAIDLDGDGTDELLTVRSLPPLGGISFRTDARVHRWTDGAFASPTPSELPVGSGDTPFILGDSDGRPGDEAAIISTLGPPGLYRIVLGPADSLTVDEFGAVVSGALGVQLDGGSGIAVVAGDVVAIHRWPAFGPPEAAAATATLTGPRLLGVVAVGQEQRLLLHQPSISTLRARRLHSLAPVPASTLTHTRAARAVTNRHIVPYVGGLPGGGPDGAPAVLFAGYFLPSPEARAPVTLRGAATVAATLAGAEPVGLVGDRSWMAILHSSDGTPPIRATGGRFGALTPLADAWLSIAPLASVLVAEHDDGTLAPPVSGALPGEGGLLTGPAGFVAELSAPAGSRVIDPFSEGAPLEVPGEDPMPLGVTAAIPDVAGETQPTVRIVLTPAGHGYVASWDVQVLSEPPPLEVIVSTPFASSEVTVSGRTAAHASVEVGGLQTAVDEAGQFSSRIGVPPWPTEIEVVASDFLGNRSRTVVSGIGILDYRALPWVPIVALLVALVGVGFYLRAPRRAVETSAPVDDAVLEELEPDA